MNHCWVAMRVKINANPATIDQSCQDFTDVVGGVIKGIRIKTVEY